MTTKTTPHQGENPDFLELEGKVKGFLLVKDEGIVKLICAAIIGNRLTADPVWLFLVAASGGGKTEFITALNKVKKIYPISSLTKNTFISGQRGKKENEASLLKQDEMQNAIMTFKDFTTLLTLHKDEQQEIMGQLREIYDGSYNKKFGTGESVDWTGKLGLIAGVTSVIHTKREMYAAMGERFIMYAINQPSRIEATRRAFDNAGDMEPQREILRNAFQEFLDVKMKVPEKIPDIPQDLKDELLKLSEFTTRARSVVERERSGAKSITFVHDKEMPMRFASQLKTIGGALMVINDGNYLTERDRKILYKLALDSVSTQRRQVLKQLIYYKLVNTPGIATKLNLMTDTVRIALEDLNVLGVIRRKKEKGKRSDNWMMMPNYRSMLAEYEDIRLTDEELTEERADEEVEEDELLSQADVDRSFEEYKSQDQSESEHHDREF